MSPRDHSFYQDLLELHISGEPLPPADRLSLFDHIEDCEACREILEAENRITARMKSVPRLVAPSDLRSRILSQAVRDHRERTTTPSEDPTIADLLKAPPDTINPTGASSAGSRSVHSHGATVPQWTKPAAPDDLPVFAGIARPVPSRLQRAWRKASPALASTFMSVAAIVALYFGHFQGIPLAGEAQQLVWAVVSSFAPETTGDLQPAIPATAVVSAESILPANLSAPIDPEPYPVSSLSPGQQVVNIADPGKPLPGTKTLASWVAQVKDFRTAVDSTVAILSHAATDPVPGPAEKAAPQIAALVLRPTDRDNSLGGFRETELADALESLAETQPGGRIARQDQFTMDGHRYKLYTLDLPAGCTDRMIQTLTPYKSTADGVIVTALNSQNGLNSHRDEAVQFYSSNEAQLRMALQTVQPVVNTGRNELLKVVLIE